jgi:phenylalanyl-tRNA synthetase beta chain
MGNPLNEEAGMLRPSLLPGMLSMLAHNLNRNVSDVQLFERGTVFSGSTERVDERPALSLGATGSLWSGPEWANHAIDFYDLKGAVEEIMERFAARSFYVDTFAAGAGIIPAWLHPGRSARAVADGLTVAWFGELTPAEAQQRKLRQSVYVGEIYLDRLYRLPLRQPIAPELSRYQPVERDFSFVFADVVRWQAIADALHNLRIAELTRFEPREIFRAHQTLPAGHYSVLIRVTFQALERTLRDEELQSYSQAVTATLESLGGRQRA